MDKILNLNDKGQEEEGFLFDVNLHDSEELDDLHYEYAFSPEIKQLKNICLIPGNKKIVKGQQIKT